MAYEQRDMSGSLFKNRNKKEPKHPNTQGSCMIAGQEYYVSGWVKLTKDGDPWISLEFKVKEPKPAAEKAEGHPAMAGLDEDIPF